MPEYVITSDAPPAWGFEPADLLRRIQEHWPEAKVGTNPGPDDPMAAEALIPFEPPRRELGVALSNNGQAVYLDPADPGTAAEFAAWLAGQQDGAEYLPTLYTMNFDVNVQLTPNITADELERALRRPVSGD